MGRRGRGGGVSQCISHICMELVHVKDISYVSIGSEIQAHIQRGCLRIHATREAQKTVHYILFDISRLWVQNLRVLSTVQSCHNSLVCLGTLWDICPLVLHHCVVTGLHSNSTLRFCAQSLLSTIKLQGSKAGRLAQNFYILCM